VTVKLWAVNSHNAGSVDFNQTEKNPVTVISKDVIVITLKLRSVIQEDGQKYSYNNYKK